MYGDVHVVSGVTSPGADSRLVFVATPPGDPPAGGWPVYFSFVTDVYPSALGNACGADAKTSKKVGTIILHYSFCTLHLAVGSLSHVDVYLITTCQPKGA